MLQYSEMISNENNRHQRAGASALPQAGGDLIDGKRLTKSQREKSDKQLGNDIDSYPTRAKRKHQEHTATISPRRRTNTAHARSVHLAHGTRHENRTAVELEDTQAAEANTTKQNEPEVEKTWRGRGDQVKTTTSSCRFRALERSREHENDSSEDPETKKHQTKPANKDQRK